jgi:queuosine precursor transporter
MVHSIIKSKPSRLFLLLSGFFIANALIAEFMGVKIFSLEDSLGIHRANINLFGSNFSFHLTAGVLLWPVVFVMTDIINEYYGRKGVRFLSYLTIALIGYAFFMFSGAIKLKPSEYFTIGNGIESANDAYKGIFGQGLWIIIGSMVAFLIGQLLDVVIFHRIKKITGDKNIWLRATGSTLVSQLVDSFVVLFIAFYLGRRIQTGQGDPWTLHQVAVTGTGNYIYKFVMAVILTPVIYLVHNIIEKYLGKETAARLKRSAMGEKNEHPPSNIPTAG